MRWALQETSQHPMQEVQPLEDFLQDDPCENCSVLSRVLDIFVRRVSEDEMGTSSVVFARVDLPNQPHTETVRLLEIARTKLLEGPHESRLEHLAWRVERWSGCHVLPSMLGRFLSWYS